MDESNKGGLFKKGLKDGFPIGIGYIPLTLAVAISAINSGISIWPWTLMTALLYTTSGQSVILNLLNSGELSILMYVVAFFIIDSRHILYSLSLSQRVSRKMPIWQRIPFIIFNTDETFAIASRQKGTLNPAYLYGLIIIPYSCQMLGTIIGCIFSATFPPQIKSACGICLYAIFVALLVSPMKSSRNVTAVVVSSLALSLALNYLPFIHLTSGNIAVICIIVICTLAAIFIPIDEEVDEALDELEEKVD